MSMIGKTCIALVMVAVAASGCSRSSNALSGVSTQSPPQALPSVPSGSVQSAQLDPIGSPQPLDPSQQGNSEFSQPGGESQNTSGNVETAALTPQPQPSSEPLTHEPLAGAWNVNSDSASCRAILSFTQWSGGYRATTLRCNSPELSSVTAWDIKSNRVVLVDNNGAQVASLAETGKEKYSGQTASGSPVSFSR